MEQLSKSPCVRCKADAKKLLQFHDQRKAQATRKQDQLLAALVAARRAGKQPEEPSLPAAEAPNSATQRLLYALGERIDDRSTPLLETLRLDARSRPTNARRLALCNCDSLSTERVLEQTRAGSPYQALYLWMENFACPLVLLRDAMRGEDRERILQCTQRLALAHSLVGQHLYFRLTPQRLALLHYQLSGDQKESALRFSARIASQTDGDVAAYGRPGRAGDSQTHARGAL